MPHYLINMVQQFENKNNNINKMHTVMIFWGGGDYLNVFFSTQVVAFFPTTIKYCV